MQRSSEKAEVAATFTFAFSISNAVPVSGSFQVIYTSNMAFSPSSCTVKSGAEIWSMTCTVDEAKRTISLKNGLTRAINPGEDISLVLSDFINPVEVVLDSFQIASFADSNSLWMIDRV